MHKHRGVGWIVLTLFFCSGATALVYEVVWSKYLSQMFGSTIQAQTVVLAVFMGGLALGNRFFGGRSDALRQPLRAYGYIEAAIGLYAFFFPAIYNLADRIFVSLGSRVLEQSGLLLSLKAVLSVGLLLGPTLLMGGTLPLLAAWLQKSSVEAGRRSARFYSVNSLGAVCGSGLAGFFLVQTLGMVATLQATALVNLLIGAAALLLGRQEASPAKADVESNPMAEPGDISPGVVRWAGLLVAITGGVSMGLEVLASRSLALIFGSSLQSFAIVLMSFILGIGLGSGVVASPRLRRWQSERLLVLLLVGAAAWIALLVIKIDWWVEFYRYAKSGLAQSTIGYRYYQFLAASTSMIVLGVPAAMIGSVLPLLIRILSGQSSALGQKVGALLTWNTLGAVIGVLSTGFVLMPGIGLRNSFAALAFGLSAVAIFSAWRRQLRSLALASGGSIALLAVLFTLGGEGWRHVISSGAFRSRETEPNPEAMSFRRAHVKILFYEDAPDATVSVEHGDGIEAPADMGLRINGKTDASSRVDLSTQLLVAHLPMAARPESKDVFILGLGSGITGGAALGHPIDHLVIAENCEPVVRAARFFDQWNAGVLTDPRARIRIEDARTLLKLSPQLYDIIITQPSNPWMVGVGSVFSREYYELGASRLKEGGVMAQWFHLYDMHDGIVSMVLRTFGTVFPYVEVWDCGAGDLVLLGSKRPWDASLAHYAKIFDRERPRQDLARIGIHTVNALLARQFASQRTGFAITGEGPIQSDLFPVLEYEAPKAFYLGISASLLNQFDERTWQQEVAPPAKRTALAKLDGSHLRSVFGQYWTINTNLQTYLIWRLRHDAIAPGATEPIDLRALPCVFRPSNSPPLRVNPPPGANQEVQLLLAAGALLDQTDPVVRSQGAAQIEALLRQRSDQSDWSAPHYAALAARAMLSAGNTAKSRQLVELGLRYAPDDLQLHYLTRILDRERPGEPRLSANP
ncbi:MAG TPA: fused MFS/spermidine synthase [Verrucomicrobiae bacterium]|nr:fused MFS/spermidine synthase [Verrucomicrobiae bacterium]